MRYVAYLGGDGMTPGGKQFRYASSVQTSFSKAKSSTKTSPSCTTVTHSNAW